MLLLREVVAVVVHGSFPTLIAIMLPRHLCINTDLADEQAGNYQLHQKLSRKKSNGQLHGEQDKAVCSARLGLHE